MAHIVITGTNQGIGLELVRQYVNRGDTVTAVCRKPGAELKQTGCEIIDNIDVSDSASINELARQMKSKPVDILFNNAGILTNESFSDLNFDRMKHQYDVNALGPLRVTKALSENLKPGSKVAIVTSRVGSMKDNGSGGNYGYRMSKAAANMAGVNLSHDLGPRDIAVILLHPGYVKTNMTGGNGMTDAATAAAGLIERVDDLSMQTTATFWHAEGYELPW